MNLYILVEGKTERRVYPKWISHLLPSYRRINSPEEATSQNYYLISCGGYPGILDNFLRDSVDDVNNSGNFNYLVIIIDTDELTSQEKKQEVHDFIAENQIKIDNCEIVVIPQMVCLETWLLGNTRIYSRNSQESSCSFFANYYDVSKRNPELMSSDPSYQGTIANFHFDYLKAMLRNKNIRYSKSNPQEVGEAHYINELLDRAKKDPDSLQTMKSFFEFTSEIKASTKP